MAVALLVASQVYAHRTPPQRGVVVQVDEKGVALLVTVEAPGRDASLLRVMHDRDRNGVLQGAEARGAAEVLLAKALGDVSLTLGDAPLTPTSTQVDLEDQGSRLSVAALVTYAVAERRESTLVVTTRQHTAPLSVLVQALGVWRLTSTSRGALTADGRGLTQAAVLEPGQALRVELAARF